MDHLHTLNDLTPKIKCQGRDGVDPELIFGLDSQLFKLEERERHTHHMNNEVQTLTISGGLALHSKAHIEETILKNLSKETVYRLKGFILLHPGQTGKPTLEILNWAFGRWDWTELVPDSQVDQSLRLTIMGERGSDLRRAAKMVAESLGAVVV